jgi:hypothetical protein
MPTCPEGQDYIGVMRSLPPMVRAVIQLIETRGYHVEVRRDRNGSLKYRVAQDGPTWVIAETLIRRFDAGRYR